MAEETTKIEAKAVEKTETKKEKQSEAIVEKTSTNVEEKKPVVVETPKEESKEKKVEEKPAEKPEVKTAAKKKRRRKSKAITTKAKKKRAVARAVAKPGKGRIRINSVPIELQEPEFRRMLLMEPVYLAPKAFENIDISVAVNGGGIMGQTVAIRGAISKAIVAISKDDKVKQKFLEYNRNLLIDDSRRKESKKPLGRGARAKKQLSKR